MLAPDEIILCNEVINCISRGDGIVQGQITNKASNTQNVVCGNSIYKNKWVVSVAFQILTENLNPVPDLLIFY